MNTKITVGIIAGIIVLGGIFFLSQDTNKIVKDSSKTTIKDNPQKDGSMTKKDEPEKIPTQSPTPTSKTQENTFCTQDAKICPDGSYVSRTAPNCEFAPCPITTHGVYKDYTENTLNEALNNNKKVVLFFHAKWCSECKADDADINANLEKIPAEITILKANYDTEKTLKQKYAITYQNTYVLIDSSGLLVKKWNNGGQGLENILKNIK